MNNLAIAFLVLNSIVLFIAPRPWAAIPLLVGACYMTLGQGIEIGPFSFTVIRLLVAVGVVRVLIKGERLMGRMISLDWLLVTWAVWALISSAFRDDPSEALIFRLGLVYNTCGMYFLLRIFCQTFEDFVGFFCITAILLLPLAGEMFFEKIVGRNLFSFLGAIPEIPWIREGTYRAQGPFAHSILAGTIGAVCFPLMIGLWREQRTYALVGIIACLTMVFASGSSGPIFTLLAGIGALFLWRIRHRMRLVRWAAIIGYILLDLVMKAPAYYLIARTGAGGAGWHRARLIEMSIKYLDEWWLAGTDYTRHWMPYGITWSSDHADITNHYVKMGVIGGLPLMILFIIILLKGFSYIGQILKSENMQKYEDQFLLWSLGASLFAHAVTMISVSYFDQSFIFLYLNLALIGSIWSSKMNAENVDQQSVFHQTQIKE